MNNAVELRQGKFYEGNKVVPIEFGNWSQIRLMNEALKAFNDLKGDGLLLDPYTEEKYEAIVEFRCVCGQSISKEKDTPYEDDFKVLQGIVRCIKCGQSYNLKLNKDGDLYATIVKKKG